MSLLLVYMLYHADCPGDYFGPGCISPCNCDQTCDQITGMCPDECLPGWFGDDCQTGRSAILRNYILIQLYIYIDII